MSRLNVYHYVRRTSVLGPGQRFGLWLQGCSRKCFACIAPDSHGDNGTNISVAEMFAIIDSVKGIQGITISGGEPLEQPDALYELLSIVKMETPLDVILFTGYAYSSILQSKNTKLLKKIDLLIDEVYDETKNDNNYLRGSSNQNFIFLSEKFLPIKDELYTKHSREFEIFVQNENNIFISGVPPKNYETQYKFLMENLNA